MVRTMKVMAAGVEGGTSFMEDYTYHFEPGNMKVLGAHMLEICPSILRENHRRKFAHWVLVARRIQCGYWFDVPSGSGLNASIVDMGNRFRLLVNTVDVVSPDAPLPNLQWPAPCGCPIQI